MWFHFLSIGRNRASFQMAAALQASSLNPTKYLADALVVTGAAVDLSDSAQLTEVAGTVVRAAATELASQGVNLSSAIIAG